MAGRRKYRRASNSNARPITLPIRPIISIALITFICFALFILAKKFIIGYPQFNIAKVTIEEASSRGSAAETQGPPLNTPNFTNDFIGKNIFCVDLSFIKERLEGQMPDTECIRVARRFPSQIICYVRRRIAVAQLGLNNFYIIDQSGLVLSGPLTIASEGLPVIAGLIDKVRAPKVGRLYDIYEIKAAVSLIAAKDKNPLLNKYRLLKIDLRPSSGPSFYIAPDNSIGAGSPPAQVQVKFDPQDLNKAVRVLGLILKKGNISLEKVEYIDIKNPDAPVIAQRKTMQNK